MASPLKAKPSPIDAIKEIAEKPAENPADQKQQIAKLAAAIVALSERLELEKRKVDEYFAARQLLTD